MTRTAWTPAGPPLPGTINATLYEPLAEVIPFRHRPPGHPTAEPRRGPGAVIRMRLRRDLRAA